MKNQYLVAGAVEGEPEWEREMAQLRPGAEEAPQSVQSCARPTPPLHVCRRRHSHYQKRDRWSSEERRESESFGLIGDRFSQSNMNRSSLLIGCLCSTMAPSPPRGASVDSQAVQSPGKTVGDESPSYTAAPPQC